MRNAYGEATYATAAEVSRNFGRWQDQALAGPVVVTHHGRPRVVVVSAQQYEAMAEAEAESNGQSDAARLQEALAALHAFRAGAAGGVMRLNRRGIVAAVDEGLARGLGLSVQTALGIPLSDLVVAADRRRLTAVLESCFDEEAVGRLEIGLNGGGETIPVSLGLAPLLKNGSVEGVMVAVTRRTAGEAVEIW